VTYFTKFPESELVTLDNRLNAKDPEPQKALITNFEVLKNRGIHESSFHGIDPYSGVLTQQAAGTSNTIKKTPRKRQPKSETREKRE
jgi:hypothetical protein